MTGESVSVARNNPFDLIREDGILNPETGELTPLEETPTPALAKVLGLLQHHIDAHLAALYAAKRLLGAEMVERMDRNASWTVREPGVEIKAASPGAGSIDWNAEKLDEILGRLVDEKIIDRGAKLRAVWPDTVYKTDKRAIDALRKIPGVEERIAEARIATPVGERKVSVRVDPRHL